MLSDLLHWLLYICLCLYHIPDDFSIFHISKCWPPIPFGRLFWPFRGLLRFYRNSHMIFFCYYKHCYSNFNRDFTGFVENFRASQVVLVVKNLPGSAGRDTRYVGLISGLGRSLEEGMATHSSILAWRIPWTEEPGRLWSIGSQRVEHY